MNPLLEPLFALSFHCAPAQDANAVLQAARERLGPSGTVRAYEVLVPPEADLDWFCQSVLPKLVYHLDSLGLRPPAAAGLFLAFFREKDLCLVHASDALAFAASALQSTPEELFRRFGTGELRGPAPVEAEPRPVPLLPPGPSPRGDA